MRDAGVGRGLTFHGLRHTTGKILAEFGMDAKTIAAVIGDKTTAMGEHYSADADRRKRVKAAVVVLRKGMRRAGARAASPKG